MTFFSQAAAKFPRGDKIWLTNRVGIGTGYYNDTAAVKYDTVIINLSKVDKTLSGFQTFEKHYLGLARVSEVTRKGQSSKDLK